MKNGDEISTTEIKAVMQEISDITNQPKTITEAISDVRTNRIIKNGTGLHSTLSNSAQEFAGRVENILTKAQKRTNGNYAVANVNVSGYSGEMKAFSKFSDLSDVGKGSFNATQAQNFVDAENIVLLRNEADRVFDTSVIKNIDRTFDTEAKILEEIAAKLGNNPNATGTVELFTKLDPCSSCKGVISQFMDRYPKIKINLYHD
ncbi:deaminase domain-containing protein [Oceanirhabdus sp. W0125-5]|uniref:deaminase domain-containing protein n=1 Tax=Oceanirhabdus sp. W0125-5 TaxID=2999116 RepID=UPI0022F30568|nr:deaminase domain-containing protein [Oceanirhabdus sp. W0125-5]WBW95947.1 deaminase domain-containing protein [Oceanirhabdus sp. W0125-5]